VVMTDLRGKSRGGYRLVEDELRGGLCGDAARSRQCLHGQMESEM
jgi:hypothetical protein